MTSFTFSARIAFGVLITLCVSNIVTGEIFKPCKVNDEACILSSAQTAFPQIAAGIPSAGVESSDPLHVDVIDGNLSILKYTLTDTTVEGFKDCKIDYFKLDINTWTLKVEMTCPKFNIVGNYVISGRLIILPVEGNGTYSIITKSYKISLESDLKKATGKDGVDHLSIKTFKVKADAQEVVEFEFKNLFNGNKELSDAVHRFANENWKEVTNLVQDPVFNANFKKIISSVNKYLKTVPFDNLFIQ